MYNVDFIEFVNAFEMKPNEVYRVIAADDIETMPNEVYGVRSGNRQLQMVGGSSDVVTSSSSRPSAYETVS